MTSYAEEGFVRINVYQAGAYWHWLVYGPAGHAAGMASSEEDAREKARQATAPLLNPWVKDHTL